MKIIPGLILCAVLPAVSGCGLKPPERGPEGSVTWHILEPENIGGNRTAVRGHPRTVDVRGKRGVEFDGVLDGLIVIANPLMEVQAFTVETIFRPAPGGNGEQCLINVRERFGYDEAEIGIRLDDDRWFLTTEIISGGQDQGLSADDFTHPVGEWHHAALVSDGLTMWQYVNGNEERSAPLTAPPFGEGRTAIGMRMSESAWFKGIIRAVRFTPKALDPEEFMER